MAIKVGYNGWGPEIRKIRGALFYKMMHKGEFEIPECCEICGSKQSHGMTFHAEQYGPTWDEYLENTYYLCPTCHGMMHVRFRFINRFKRYIERVRTHGQHMPFPSLSAFFQYSKNIKDIPAYPQFITGIAWLDDMPLTPYEGPDKVAYIEKDGVLIPDPLIYKGAQLQLIAA